MAITHLVARRDYRRMPWKNGGGETVEIARFPEGVDLGSFDWRISMATVASDGPFSSFPGIDRTLAVLDGEGLRLHRGEGPEILTCGGEPLAFPADVPTVAQLIDGPIADLNLMTRRGIFIHRMTCLSLPADVCGPALTQGGAGHVFVLVRGAAQAFSQEGNMLLADLDVLHLTETADRVRITGDRTAYLLEIVPSGTFDQTPI